MPTVLLVTLALSALTFATGIEGQSRFQRRAQTSTMRFAEMDRNNDGAITRDEWRGSGQSFRVHDWNEDGVLSGDEVRVGATRRERSLADDDFDPATPDRFNHWSEATFADVDHNRDGRITSNEWHFDAETFRRVDRNRDGMLTRTEFLSAPADDDRDDRFENLDVNGNGRVERSEWHGSADAFDWLDRDKNNVLSRREVMGEAAAPEPVRTDRFANLDFDRDGAISPAEWHRSRRSFDQRDTNRDGRLTRDEFAAAGAVATTGQTVRVNAKERWTDTGISVAAGDTVMIEAEGSVTLSEGANDVAGPAGARSGRKAPDAPLKDELAGGLIARFGDSAPVFVGNRKAITAPQAGRVYLSVNDDHLADNAGEYRVTIAVRSR
jgi:Ca2+-binding EF-hand superfamily protein